MEAPEDQGEANVAVELHPPANLIGQQELEAQNSVSGFEHLIFNYPNDKPVEKQFTQNDLQNFKRKLE